MVYLGEAGIGRTGLSATSRVSEYPWFGASCGDKSEVPRGSLCGHAGRRGSRSSILHAFRTSVEMELDFLRSHTSESWRVTFGWTMRIGPDTYEPGDFRFLDAWKYSPARVAHGI